MTVECDGFTHMVSGRKWCQWTVLVLRPDHMLDGSVQDWIYQAHVIAPDVAAAEIAGREQAAKADGEDEPFDYSILAVYVGHLSDVANT